MKTVHGAEFYAAKKHKSNEHDQDGERRFREVDGSCQPMTPMTPNSNGSGSPKIKTEVGVLIILVVCERNSISKKNKNNI